MMRLTRLVSFYNHIAIYMIGYAMNPKPSQLDLTFAALSDPTRRAILARLARGEATVNELVEPFEMSQPAISKHIKVLEAAGLVTRGKDAQRRPVRIAAAPMAAAVGWLEEFRTFWETSYGRLDGLLAELQSIAPKSDKQN